jgi:hypothetical protein
MLSEQRILAAVHANATRSFFNRHQMTRAARRKFSLPHPAVQFNRRSAQMKTRKAAVVREFWRRLVIGDVPIPLPTTEQSQVK